MTGTLDTFITQLKEACKVTGAHWAASLRRSGQRWELINGYALRKAQRGILLDFIQETGVATWLAGALSSGHVRYRKTGSAGEALNCGRIFAFPNPKEPVVILVGADNLDSRAQGIFRILSLTKQEQQNEAGTEAAVNRSRFSELELEASYDPEHVLEQVLAFIVKGIPCNAAYLAVRSGDFFRIETVWRCSALALGLDIRISENPNLLEMIDTRQGVMQGDIHKEPTFSRILTVIDRPVKSYLRVPIVVGNRVTGDVVLLSNHQNHFTQAHLESASRLLERLAPAIEYAITFQEATRYLQRFALLNDIASAASQSVQIDEIASSVVIRLRRIFRTDLVSVLLMTEDRLRLQEYGKTLSSGDQDCIPVQASLVGYVVEQGRPVRIGDVREAPRFLQDHIGVQSALVAPLKYRGDVIGAIDVESLERNAFSDEDQQLLVMIASQLAGLFENARLNQETRQRNLELQEHIEAHLKAESQLIRSARLAAVGEMAAGMAHELNNPLTTIIGFVELALEELPNDLTLRADLELVLREAQRARGVVRRLLDFSHQGDPLRQPSDVNELVENVISLMQHQIQSSCIQLQVFPAADLPLVLIDPDQIKQVLLNLVQNALQAMPNGGTLSVQTQVERNPAPGKDPGVLISVRDSGEGIPLEIQDRIFEPFYTTRPTGAGNGLGLSVSYGIITAHSGQIEVESQEGQGSCFTIWLPLKGSENNE